MCLIRLATAQEQNCRLSFLPKSGVVCLALYVDANVASWSGLSDELYKGRSTEEAAEASAFTVARRTYRQCYSALCCVFVRFCFVGTTHSSATVVQVDYLHLVYFYEYFVFCVLNSESAWIRGTGLLSCGKPSAMATPAACTVRSTSYCSMGYK